MEQDYPVSELYVMAADAAVIENGRLTLSGLDATVIWFTDRPARQAGRAATEVFIANWPEGTDSFAVDPPNAVLVGSLEGENQGEIDGESWEIAVELLDPVWQGEDLSLGVVALADPLPDSLRLANVHLFIDNDDDVGLWCGGECFQPHWRGR